MVGGDEELLWELNKPAALLAGVVLAAAAWPAGAEEG
jgi:hypothetical protein